MKIASICGFFLVALSTWGQEVYTVTPQDGGPFRRYTTRDYVHNDGSYLRAQVLLLNINESSLKLTGADVVFSYQERRHHIAVTLKGEKNKETAAVRYRIALFDPFGDWITSLRGNVYRDQAVGAWRDSGTWSTPDILAESLYIVAWVEKVRFRDGVMWTASKDAVVNELVKLRLSGSGWEN